MNLGANGQKTEKSPADTVKRKGRFPMHNRRGVKSPSRPGPTGEGLIL